MKITILIGSLVGGGAERVVCNLSNYLVKHGNRVSIWVMSESVPVENLENEIDIIPLLRDNERGNFITNNLKRYFRLKKNVKNINTDCYIVFLPATTCLLLHLRKYTKTPIIMSERSYPNTYRWYTRLLLRYYAKRATKVVCLTDDIGAWYKKCTNKSQLCIIPNAINSHFIGIEAAEQKEKRIVAVGRLNKAKNYKLLLHAFSVVSHRFEEYRLEIYGKGEEEDELKALAKELQLEGKVEFKGFSRNICQDIKNASLYVLSSDYEGMPNTLMEAMALGVPCVSTDCNGGGARFLIDNLENGLLVPRNDVNALSLAMCEVLGNDELARKISTNAQKITEKLNPTRIYSTWERVIDGTIQSTVQHC